MKGNEIRCLFRTTLRGMVITMVAPLPHVRTTGKRLEYPNKFNYRKLMRSVYIVCKAYTIYM